MKQFLKAAKAAGDYVSGAAAGGAAAEEEEVDLFGSGTWIFTAIRLLCLCLVQPACFLTMSAFQKKKNVYLIFFSDGLKNNTFSQKEKLTILWNFLQ